MKKLIELELSTLARWLIGRFRPFVIGATGSSGKTTTKYFIGELIKSSESSVRTSSGNMNTKLGLSLAILGYSKSPDSLMKWFFVGLYSPIKALLTFKFEKFLVLEYGMDTPGDMQKLINICQPDITVVTNIATAHIEIFKTEENIIKEKWLLAQSAKEAVITDKLTVAKIKDLEKLRPKIYILPSIKYAKAENINVFSNKVEFDFYLNNKKKQTSFHFFGDHNIRNLEMAAFAAYLSTAQSDKILQQIMKLQPLPGRGRRIFLKRSEILILDESYNANPLSMKAALETLKNIKYGRKVAILGEMGEIGPIAKEAHIDIAEQAKSIAEFTVGVGKSFKNLGLDIWYEDVSELNKELGKILKEGDLVLIKGSLSNELGKTVKYLEEL